ncbi:solute carrier family 46 member 3-like [Patiria miniata]|uniref:Proton-coupled folate transporter n=1 Tax=Patiria miniata TaxID=46514 RepID=A0A913Z0P5_PATMI|nr:solute carrier family 46 member 3-like [Patiria miniata]XP_038076093.1 solute carrier family 46 member 3-like [Patiria miniata]
MANAEVELQQCSVETSSAGLSNRERAQRRWVTVEPVVSLAVIGFMTIGLIRPFFLKKRIGESYNVTVDDEFSNCNSNDTGDKAMQDGIQAEASLWIMYLNVSSSIPVIISSVIMGTLSDRLGRKMCIVIPIFGYICQEVVYLATIYFELPLPVLFVGDILQGMAGGFGLLFAGCTSYITDITSEKKRTLRIAFIEMLLLLLGGFVQVGVGYMVRDISTEVPLLMALGANVLCLIYVAIPGLLIETVDRKNIPEHRKGLKAAGRSMVKLLKFNENGRRWQMLLLDFFLFFVIININGTMSIFILYGTAKPLCWSPVDAGLAGSFGFLTASIGMVVGTKLFALCVGEYWIMQISCLSLLAFNIMMGVTQTTWLVYAANLIGAFRATSMPIARSIISRIVDSTEIGAAFALVACIDSVAGFIASAVGPSIYAATVKYLPPAVFFVYSGFYVIPAGIIVVLQLLWPRREAKDKYQQFEDEPEESKGYEVNADIKEYIGKPESIES